MTKEYRTYALPTLLFILLAGVMKLGAESQFVNLHEFEGTVLDMEFRSGSEGYALTEEQLWHTTDAGATWQREVPKVFHSGLTSIDLFGAGDMVLGDRSGMIYIFRSEDSSWRLSSTQGGQPITDIEVVGYDHWFALTDSALYITEDGGLTYRRSTPEEGTTLATLDVTDASLIHVAAASFWMWRSVDGGTTWEKMEAAVGNIYDILFLSEEVGFIASWYPWNLFSTTDGGETWQAGPYEYPTAIDVIPGGTGAYTTREYVRTSEDGGKTWSDSLAFAGVVPEEFGLNYVRNQVRTPEQGFIYVLLTDDLTQKSIITRVDVTSDVEEEVRRMPTELDFAILSE